MGKVNFPRAWRFAVKERMTDRARLIPIIVACPLLLQNLDTSIMATALPSIARSLGVQALHVAGLRR
ncbi:MAG TPA: hypothetical protein VGL08_07395 [Paraburkholderia sp.]